MRALSTEILEILNHILSSCIVFSVYMFSHKTELTEAVIHKCYPNDAIMAASCVLRSKSIQTILNTCVYKFVCNHH